MKRFSCFLFWFLLVVCCWVSPAVALFMGMALAVTLGNPYGGLSKKVSKYLLQAAVVGLGFGMDWHASLAAGKEGVVFTIASVVGVMVVGCLLGRWMRVPGKVSYLIASGTAICGGSAIAAVAPVVKADAHETSVSLAVVFALNALALFIFPPIGAWLGLSEGEFGLWAAIAIHDTSSVVGAASAYGEEALAVATTVKLTRALWIIPLSLITLLLFLRRSAQSGEGSGKAKVSVPWFIALFVGAMLLNTYLSFPPALSAGIKLASHKALSVTLFLIGSGLSLAALRQVGCRPVLLGVSLWGLISAISLAVVL